MRRLVVRLAWVGVLAGCPRPVDETVKCNSTADCTRVQRCQDGICVLDTGGGSSGLAGASSGSATAASSLGGVSSGSGVSNSGCPPQHMRCDGLCVDPATDEIFCGASADCLGTHRGQICVGEVCVAGACVSGCPSEYGLVQCSTASGTGTYCVDPASSTVFCGAHDDCAGTNAGATCAEGGTCVGGTCSCPDGGRDCNGACVPGAACCTTTECSAGRQCLGVPDAGHKTCACQPGDVDCAGTCVSNQGCCSNADCTGGRICGAPASSVAANARRDNPSATGPAQSTRAAARRRTARPANSACPPVTAEPQ